MVPQKNSISEVCGVGKSKYIIPHPFLLPSDIKSLFITDPLVQSLIQTTIFLNKKIGSRVDYNQVSEAYFYWT